MAKMRLITMGTRVDAMDDNGRSDVRSISTKRALVGGRTAAAMVIGAGPAWALAEPGWPAGVPNTPRSPGDGFIDFEDGADGAVIASTIPGVVFSTTFGIDWRYADKSTGHYNIHPYGEQSYEIGNVGGWLGVTGDAGRIDFTEGTATYLSLLCSTYSGLVIEGYDADDNLIATSGWADDNLHTRTLTRLTIEAPQGGPGMKYVVMHDSGNYWIVDDIATDAPGIEPSHIPVAQCRDLTIEVDGACTAEASIDDGSWDPDDDPLTLAQDPPGPYAIGQTVVTLTVSDADYSVTCTGTVTVRDANPPVLTCPADVTVSADAACVAAAALNATATDDCDPSPVVAGPTPAGPYPLGQTTVTFSATDASGNTAECQVVVTVEDTTPPVIVCPADLTVDADANCEASPALAATATDNCVSSPAVSGPAPPGPYPLGTTVVTFSAQDAAGNAATCAMTVTVVSGSLCDPDIANDDAAATAEDTPVTVDVAANDVAAVGSLDLSSVSVISGPSQGVAANNGDGTITYLPAPDYNGPDSLVYEICDTGANCDQATVSLTVTPGNDPPVPYDDTATALENGPAVTVHVTANDTDVDGDALSIASADATSVAGAAITILDGDTVSYDPDSTAAFESLAAGEQVTDTFSYLVTDGIETVAASVEITVTGVNDVPVAADDTAAAVENGPPVVVDVMANDYDVEGDPIEVTGVDATSAVGAAVTLNVDGTVSYDPDSTTAFESLGVDDTTTDTFDYTMAEAGGGTPVTATVTVTVTGVNDDPVAVCTPGIQVTAGGNISPIVRPADLDLGSYDVDGDELTLSMVPESLTCDDLGLNPVTLTVTDEHGASSSCDTFVFVVDDVPPDVDCPPDIELGTDDDPDDLVLVGEATAFDNCDVVSLTHTDSSVTVGSVTTITRTWTATDAGGNNGTCMQTITWVHNRPPVANCQDITVELDATGNATITANDVDDGSTDPDIVNGDGITLSIDIDSFDCDDLDAAVAVTLTVTDDFAGATDTCVSMVTVVDVTPPSITCPDDDVQECPGDTCVLATGAASGSDVCGDVTIEFTDSVLDQCGATETVMRTWRATDDSGNSDDLRADDHGRRQHAAGDHLSGRRDGGMHGRHQLGLDRRSDRQRYLRRGDDHRVEHERGRLRRHGSDYADVDGDRRVPEQRDLRADDHGGGHDRSGHHLPDRPDAGMPGGHLHPGHRHRRRQRHLR